MKDWPKTVNWRNASVMGKCGRFFFRATTLVSRGKSHSSRVRGLVVRCLLFNPGGFVFEPCVCSNFLQVFRSRRFSLFSALWELWAPLFRLCETFFRKFFCVVKVSSLQFVWYFATERMLENFSLFRFFGTMRLSKFFIFCFFERLQTVSLQFFFWNFATEWMLKNLKGSSCTVFGIVRFLKNNNFCLQIRFSQAQHVISDFRLFKDRCFLYATFKIRFHRSPPQFLQETETFCERKGLLKVFGTMRLIGNLHQKIFSKNSLIFGFF